MQQQEDSERRADAKENEDYEEDVEEDDDVEEDAVYVNVANAKGGNLRTAEKVSRGQQQDDYAQMIKSDHGIFSCTMMLLYSRRLIQFSDC